MGRELFLMVAFLAVAGCGRLGFAPGGDDEVRIDAPIPSDSDTALSVTPAICNARTLGTVLVGVEIPLAVRAAKLASGGYAVATGTDGGAVRVARILPDGSFAGIHTPLPMGYTLEGAATIGDNVFLYAINGSPAYLKALDPTWDAYATAQAGEGAIVDPPLALMPGGSAWLGVVNAGSTTLSEVGADGMSTGFVADYQPVTATNASFAAAPTGVRAAIDRGDGTCETLVIGPGGVTSLRETIQLCSIPRHAPFASSTGMVLFEQPGGDLAAKVIDDDPMTSGVLYMLGDVDNARIMTREGRSWIGYTAAGSSVVQLVSIGADGLVSGAAADLRPPFDLLEKRAFWVEGSELLTGDTCVN